MKKKTVKNIELTWEYTGSCPDQWYSYFYNEHNDKTYCVYIRQGSCSWSANLRSADGKYTGDDFEKLSTDKLECEIIELAFDYLSYLINPYDVEDRYFRRIVKEIVLYLNHRFSYFHFDSQECEKFDFIGEIAKGDKDSRMEVLSRRAKLMRKYLAEYEKFLKSIQGIGAC